MTEDEDNEELISPGDLFLQIQAKQNEKLREEKRQREQPTEDDGGPLKRGFTEHYVLVRNQKFSYTLELLDANRVHLRCFAAGVDRALANKDLTAWLMNLPKLILEALKKQKKETPCMVRFRLSREDKEILTEETFRAGYPSVSEYIRAKTVGEPERHGVVRPYGRNRKNMIA